MKKIIITMALLLTVILIWTSEITDPLWLKAVDLKSESLNIYPEKTTYISQTKDKKGNVEQEETIVISHTNQDGKVINSLVKAYNNDGDLTEDNDSVQRYLSMKVVSDDLGVFKTETTDDFIVENIGNEVIDGKEYVKYLIDMKTESDGKTIESDGYIWIEKETAIPYKLSLDVDPNQMMVKELKVDTFFSLSPDGYLQTDKVETNVVISMVFKKMYISQIVTRENYQKLN